MVLVKISLEKESDLAGFEGQLWQLINGCWQLMKISDDMDKQDQMSTGSDLKLTSSIVQ